MLSVVFYSAAVKVQSIVINPSVCASVCLRTSISLEPLDRSSRNIVCGSPMPVARSSSGGVELRYVLPVLWMTSRLAVMGATPKHRGCTVQRRP